jgi:hypothetical protein
MKLMKRLPVGLLAAAISILVTVRGGVASAPQATDPNITATRVIGEVIEVNQSANRFIIKTEAGNAVTVFLDQSTDYLRVPPGEVSLDKAIKIALSEIGPGDKVYARGRLSEDKKSLPAQKVIVMLKADIEKNQERQRQEWQARGVAGIVTALNPNTREITLQVGGREGFQTLIVTTTDAVKFRRYLPDSVRFSDARPGSFSDLKINDQVRALGEKNVDGTRFAAQQVVSGSFRTVTGTVTAVDAATGELQITALGKKQLFTIMVSKDAVLRRITPQLGIRIARAMPSSRTGSREGASGTPSSRNTGSSGDELQRALENLALLALSDIKPGDMIAVTSTIGADPLRLTAVTLVSGVDNVLNAIQSAEGQRNSPSMDMGLSGGLFDAGVVRQ